MKTHIRDVIIIIDFVLKNFENNVFIIVFIFCKLKIIWLVNLSVP